MSPQKRSYSPKKRESQAIETRSQVMEAARNLFFQNGYGRTTINAIASAAGVSQETVYAIFRNKQTILLNILNQILVGDSDPTPLLQRPFILSTQAEVDQKRLIKKIATDMHDIMSRMSPIFSLLQSEVNSEPIIAKY